MFGSDQPVGIKKIIIYIMKFHREKKETLKRKEYKKRRN